MRLALLVLIACGPRPTTAPSGAGRDRGELEVTLYRDRATVAQRLEVSIPAATTGTARLQIAAGVDPADIYIVDKSELVIREARSTADKRPIEDGCDEVSCVLDDYERECCQRFVREQWEGDGDRPEPPAKELPSTPTEVELVVGGPRPGKYTLVVGYDTDKITWDAAYTITTTAAHDRGQLRGALSVRNATGVPLRRARVRVVDAEHAALRDRVAARGNDPNSTPIPQPRELATLDLAPGETRIELLPDATTRPLRSVLVYDPIGPGLDYAHATPVQDPNLGVLPPPTTRVLESFELERTQAMRHLPAGAVRLLERRPDGTLGMLGEARLFGPSTLAAAVDAVAVGTAEGVVARRERRDLTLDNDRRRVVEEIAITVENKRAQAVEVVLREHLYRGENWAIAYWSVPDIVKEGKQQIAMRVAVPPRQTRTVLYVVVYSWGQ